VIGRTGIRSGFLSVLSDQDVDRIHSGAIQVLSQTGVLIQDEAILRRMGEAGCDCDPETARCRIPKRVIEEALKTVPKVVRLYNRFGGEAMSLGSGAFHARTSSGATHILDSDTGRLREPTLQDAADVARLADALPYVHGVSTMAVQPAETPLSTVDLHVARAALMNTTKPLGHVCLNESLIEPVLEMSAAVVGGRESLRRRPILTALAESTSPLRFVRTQLAVARAFASWGVPLTVHAHPMAGLTSPVTLAGELVVTHAEILAWIAITQVLASGTPVVYGMSSSVPNMRNMLNLSGAVEIGLLGGAVARLSRHIGLPCLMSTGSDAHAPGAQSVMERLMTLLLPAWAGMDLVNLTTLETKMSFSPTQLVLDNALLEITARMFQGITVNDETLALDLIQQMGSVGGFFATPHTVRHFRKEIMVPALVGRETREVWEAAGGRDMADRAREKALLLLAEHHPPALPEKVVEQLDEIVCEAETRSGFRSRG
jgi:trimethylamine--corrinoid protein Co-methyltransferase